MKKTKDSGQPISGVNIAPVIDVALVLVIIMLIATPVMNIPNMPVNLPEAVTKESKEKNISVSFAQDGRVSVDEEIVSWDTIAPKLNNKLKKDKNILVIIRADKDVMYADVEKLINHLKKTTYAKRIAVATRQRTTKVVRPEAVKTK
jgi:biopolymer transport protein TolR